LNFSFFFPFRKQETDINTKQLEAHISPNIAEFSSTFSFARLTATKNIQNDDIDKGIIELISLHGITKLVMGAASDKNYSKYGQNIYYCLKFLVSSPFVLR